MPFYCTPDVSVKREGAGGKVIPVRCKRWSCPHCAIVNRQRVIMFAKGGEPTAMMTLTVSTRNYDTPDEAAEDLKRGLVALRKRITRRWPNERMPFIAVFEQHKSGWPHLHLLIRCRFMPVEWLRECWTEITGSWNVNITKIDKGRAGHYVAKYIGKDLHSFAHCKRWWRSHDYDLQDRELTEEELRALRGWSRMNAEPDRMALALKHIGCILTVDGAGRITYHDPPTGPPDMRAVAQLSRFWYKGRAT